MHTDSLATLTTSSAQDLPRVVLVEDLYTPISIHHSMPRIYQIKLGPSQMNSISLFMKKDILPEEKSETEKVRRKAPRFWLSEDRKLQKRFFSGLYLHCVHPEASESLLEELHEGVCGSYTGGRSLSHRALIQGYWWPGMQKEVQECIKKCNQCQKFGLIFTSLEEFSTLFLALGNLLNRAWTLWDLSLKRQEIKNTY